MNATEYRIEHDALGEVRVPADVLWGAQTQRAVENFPISGQGFPRSFIRALARVKLHAASVNTRLGELDRVRGDAIVSAAREVLEGKHDDQFPVDVYQTGSGTSTNMNMNEVLAHRANVLLGRRAGDEGAVHPNDHVNRGQSSNDVIPTALHLAVLESAASMLLPSLDLLRHALRQKAEEFSDIVKIGRTHLMDAVPLTLGQEFGGYEAQLAGAVRRIGQARAALFELPLGGTAVGTGLNAHPEFARSVIAALAEESGVPLREAANHFEAQAARDAAVEFSGAMKTVAVSLMKIANDVRWMSSGPRAGLAELLLPELQPGSSIMPGKINPVIPEAVAMVCARVIGNDATITVAGQSGSFELNVMMPVIAVCLLESTELLANASRVFATRCVSGIRADAEGLRSHVQRSLMLVTALVPEIGYEAAAGIAQEAYRSGKTIREVVLEQGVMDEQRLRQLFEAAGL